MENLASYASMIDDISTSSDALKAELAAAAESDIDVEIQELDQEDVDAQIDSFADIVDATARDGSANSKDE